MKKQYKKFQIKNGGNGEERKERLTKAGYNYNRIQEKVNKRLNQNLTYIIKKGDTLTSIARKHNTTVNKLVELNNIKNPDLIYANQILKIKQVNKWILQKKQINQQIYLVQ